MNRENEQTRSIVSGINEYYKQAFGFNEELISLVSECEDELAGDFARQEKIAEYWQARVLTAFQNARISDTHFGWNTGYGHNDQGREKTEEVFAGVFGTEKALVRTNIVNGTHAIALALLGVLRAGDELIYASGTPYDTMQTVIGTAGTGEKG
ncbi:MAG: methionine gamma-lyase family protein, partial [Firmicutes bacterium]|nr:methionine gamma-lyase family protein [Bacillota bacterium]